MYISKAVSCVRTKSTTYKYCIQVSCLPPAPERKHVRGTLSALSRTGLYPLLSRPRERQRERELSPLSGTPRAGRSRSAEPEAGAEENKKRTPNTRHAAPGSRTARDGKSAKAQARSHALTARVRRRSRERTRSRALCKQTAAHHMHRQHGPLHHNCTRASKSLRDTHPSPSWSRLWIM